MPNPRGHVAQRLLWKRRVIMQFTIILTYFLHLLATMAEGAIPVPYHTSALTGQAWVLELMAGHPGRIRCELGVSIEVFAALVAYLREIGVEQSKYVTLEEQVAIFLYMAVTGLSIRHAGK